jgi:hypothetical protein
MSIAHFIGIVRFSYRPLVLPALGFGLCSIASLAIAYKGGFGSAIESPWWVSGCVMLGTTCIIIYQNRFQKSLEDRGIHLRHILFFAKKGT